jgi:lipid A disaccharide synthetase
MSRKYCQRCNIVFDSDTYHDCTARSIHPSKDIQAAFKRSVEAEREIEKLKQEVQILREKVAHLESANRVLAHGYTHRFPADYLEPPTGDDPDQ